MLHLVDILFLHINDDARSKPQQKFLFELALCGVRSLYNFHWFIDLDLSSVSHVTASAALTLFDIDALSRLLRCMNTKLHVVTNHKTVLFIVDMVIIFNLRYGDWKLAPYTRDSGSISGHTM